MFGIRTILNATHILRKLPKKIAKCCSVSGSAVGTKIRSLWEYGAPIWDGIPQYLVDELESIQTRILRILGSTPKDSLPSLLERRDSLTLREYERIKP